jgi:hypothetical protein
VPEVHNHIYSELLFFMFILQTIGRISKIVYRHPNDGSYTICRTGPTLGPDLAATFNCGTIHHEHTAGGVRENDFRSSPTINSASCYFTSVLDQY